jgi:hypothetical protein
MSAIVQGPGEVGREVSGLLGRHSPVAGVEAAVEAAIRTAEIHGHGAQMRIVACGGRCRIRRAFESSAATGKVVEAMRWRCLGVFTGLPDLRTPLSNCLYPNRTLNVRRGSTTPKITHSGGPCERQPHYASSSGVAVPWLSWPQSANRNSLLNEP